MKWFTRGWHDGELPDDRWALTVPTYRAHVEQLRPALAGRAEGLLDLDLHDAWVLDLVVEANAFTWSLLIGDLQAGYEVASLRYAGARVELSGTEPDALTRVGVEVLSDEVDREGEALVHRVLFWPAGELDIAFDALTVATRPTPERRRPA